MFRQQNTWTIRYHGRENDGGYVQFYFSFIYRNQDYNFYYIMSYCVLLRNHYIIWFKILKSPCVFWNMSPSDNQAPKDMDLDNSSKYNNGTLFYVIRWSICCWYWSMYTRKCRKRLVQARRLVRTGHDDNLSLRFVFNLMLYHWSPYWSGHHFENHGKLQTFFFWIC